MFIYCPKCGLIIKQKNENMCPVCNNELKPVPDKYLSQSKNLFISSEARDNFIKEVIETDIIYDNELSKRRDDILKETEINRKKAIEQKVQNYKDTKITFKCPICGSSNLSDISIVGKAVKISLLGVWGAGDLGKKRYCNSCGHKF